LGGRLNFNGSLGGTGSMVIQDGGTLEVQSGILADTVNFAGVGTLEVDGLNLVTGTLNGLATGDVIDFAHAILTGAVVNNNTLTVTLVGGQTETFTLAGPLPAGDFFQTAIDGAGGTEVVVTNGALPPPPTYTWNNGTSGDWGTASDWSGAVVPDGTANATIDGTGAETVTVSANQAVNVLILDDANATLSVTDGAALSAFGGLAVSAIHEIDITNGELLFGGGSQTVDNSTINLGDYTMGYYGTLTTDTASLTPAVLTLGPNLIVNAGFGQIGSGSAAGDGIVNQGEINDTGYLSINGYAVANQGAIGGGGSLIINYESSFSNSGTISVINLSANGYGNFSNSGMISGSSLNLVDYYGSFTNTNTGTIAADVSGGSSSINSNGYGFDNEAPSLPPTVIR
jgi:hypothetical protein